MFCIVESFSLLDICWLCELNRLVGGQLEIAFLCIFFVFVQLRLQPFIQVERIVFQSLFSYFGWGKGAHVKLEHNQCQQNCMFFFPFGSVNSLSKTYKVSDQCLCVCVPAFILVSGLMVEQSMQTCSTICSNFERENMLAFATSKMCTAEGMQCSTKSYLSMRSTFKYAYKAILMNTFIAIETTIMLLLPVHAATESSTKNLFFDDGHRKAFNSIRLCGKFQLKWHDLKLYVCISCFANGIRCRVGRSGSIGSLNWNLTEHPFFCYSNILETE